MKGPLRACALLLLLGSWLDIAAAQNPAANDPPAPLPAESPSAPQPAFPAPPIAPLPAVEPPPLQEIPETTVTGQPAGTGAQGNAISGTTLLSTPTRTETQFGEIGSSISVVTSEQISQRKITSVVEALRTLPGLTVVQSGGPGRQASVFIRGADSSQTKVLLDGIWMNDPSTADRSFDFSSMSIDNIDRIEVIRGPQSSLYGSDAMGGVINIITKRGSGKMQVRAGALGGSLYTQREWGNVSGGTELYNYSIGGSYFGSKNIASADAGLPGNAGANPFYLGTVSSRVGFTPTENLTFDFIVRYNRANVKYDNEDQNNMMGAFQANPNQFTATNQLYTREQVRYVALDGFWDQTLSFNTTNVQRYTTNPGSPLQPLESLYETDLGQTQIINWQNNFRLHETNTVTVGLMHQQENATSNYNGTYSDGGSPPMAIGYSGVDPRAKLTDKAIYAQDQIRLFDRWFTTIGGRSDHYSLAGVADTYRVTSLYRFKKTKTAIRGSGGSGFKAPTLYQLFDATSGNTMLKPEQSTGWDCGIDQPFFDNQLTLSATYFRNNFKDLIQFEPNPSLPFGGAYYNVGHARTDGIELAATVNIDTSTYMTLNYTRLNAVDLDTGLPLVRRPRDQIGWTFNRKYLDNRLNLNFNGWFMGNRQDIDYTSFTDNPVTLKHYWILNLAGTYDIRKNLQAFVRFDNMLDQHYQEVFGYGSVPLTFYGGTTMNW